MAKRIGHAVRLGEKRNEVKLFFADRQIDVCCEFCAAKDAMCGRLEIAVARFENIGNEFLRIAIDERKPCALDLHHDFVADEEAMIHLVQAESVGQGFVALEARWMFEAFAKTA